MLGSVQTLECAVSGFNLCNAISQTSERQSRPRVSMHGSITMTQAGCANVYDGAAIFHLKYVDVDVFRYFFRYFSKYNFDFQKFHFFTFSHHFFGRRNATMEALAHAIYENRENVRSFGNFYPSYGMQYVYVGQSLFTHDNFLFDILKAEHRTAENLSHRRITVNEPCNQSTVLKAEDSDHYSDCESDYESVEGDLICERLPLANITRPRRRAHRHRRGSGSRGRNKSHKH